MDSSFVVVERNLFIRKGVTDRTILYVPMVVWNSSLSVSSELYIIFTFSRKGGMASGHTIEKYAYKI